MPTRSLFVASIFLCMLFANNISGHHVVDKTKNEMWVKLSGGNEAISHEAPWVISVQRLDYSTLIFNHMCGGSILKPHVIVTAAHCLLDFRLELGYIYAGRHNLTKQELLTQQHRLFNHSNIIIHEGYTYGISADDIGLIKLLDPFVMNEYVSEISLPLSNVIPYGFVRLYGWGRTINEGIGGVLFTAVTSIIDFEECNLNFSSTVLDTNICTASEGVAACAGDSGGAVTQRTEDGVDEVVVGIVSWGFSLCGRPPSVHTRVSAYVDWILRNSAEKYGVPIIILAISFIHHFLQELLF